MFVSDGEIGIMLGSGIVTKLKAMAQALPLRSRASNGFSRLADPTPLSAANRLGPRELTQLDLSLARSGVRKLPYPFKGIMALASDTDGSSRADYEFYSRLFVAERGLDFGDSVRLIDSPVGDFPGMKLFGWNAELPPRGQYRPSRDGLSFHETLRECFLGNIDHFHGLMNSGPKIVVLDVAGAASRSVNLPPASSYCATGVHGAAPMPVLGILLHGRNGAPTAVESVTVRLRSGVKILYRRVNCESGDWLPKLESEGRALVFEPDPDRSESAIPAMRELDEVSWDATAGNAQITSIGFVNLHRAAILRATEALVRDFGVSFSLLTDCTAFAFAGEGSARNHARRNIAQIESGAVSARYGRLNTETHYHACYVDDPNSFAYVLPEIAQKNDLHFINPAGWTGETGVDIPVLNLIVPAKARNGQGIYVARRSLEPLPDCNGIPDPQSSNQGTLTISRRMAALLDRFESTAGDCVWTLYTHLGNLRPKPADTAGRRVHFPAAVFDRIQDSAFGITSTARSAPRMMFTRASLSYEYAMLVRGLAENPNCVSRNGDRIEISSWIDPVLKKRYPDNVNRLNGVTFYHDRPDRATILLDTDLVEWLSLNGPDETGRPSVTVVGRGFLHEPLAAMNFDSVPGAVSAENCRYTRSADGLEIEILETGFACLRIAMKDFVPLGAQSLLAYLERAAGVACCVDIETANGGCFRFFDCAEPTGATWPETDDITATYRPPYGSGGTPMAVPFSGLSWHASARPNGPMPSHPTATVSIRMHGTRGERVIVRRLAFNRPGVKPSTMPGDRIVLGGRIDGGVIGDKVDAIVAYSNRTTELTTEITDNDGWFLFSGIPSGARVELRAEAAAPITVETRQPSMTIRLRVRQNQGDD